MKTRLVICTQWKADKIYTALDDGGGVTMFLEGGPMGVWGMMAGIGGRWAACCSAVATDS